MRRTLLIGASLSLLAALLASQYAAYINHQVTQASLEQSARVLEQEITRTLLSVEGGLRSARGIWLSAEPKFDREHFLHFIQSRDLAREFPGLTAFAWVQRVQPAETQAILAEAQAEQPGFQLLEYQANPGERYLLRYIEPVPELREALGLDLASEPVRKQALDQCAQSNTLCLSPPLQDSAQRLSSTPDFIAILPVRKDQQLYGWMLAPLYLRLMLQDTLATQFNLAISLKDQHTQLNFGSPSVPPGKFLPGQAPVTLEKTAHFYNRQWQLQLAPARDLFVHLPLYDLRLVFVVIFTSGLLLTLIRLLLNHQKQQKAEQHNQLAQIIDAAPCGMMLLSSDYHFVAVNQRLCEQTGYTRQELLGASFARIMGTTVAGENLLLNQSLDQSTLDTMIARKNGDTFPAAFGFSTLELEGKPHLIATLEDVTERRKIERKIAENEATFRQLANAMPQHVWISNPRGRAIYINQRCQDFFQRDLDYLNQHWLDFAHPDDANRARTLWQTAVAIGQPYSCELRYKNPHGQYCWFLSRAIAVKDSDGSIVAWYGTNTDITQAKQAQEVMAQEARNTQAIVDGIMDAIITIDEQGNIQQFNNAAETLFGYTEQEVLNRNVKLLMPEPHRHQHDNYLANYVRTGQAKIIGKGAVVDGLHKNGSRFKIELRIAEIWHQERRHFMGMVRDITVRYNNDKLLLVQDHILGMIAANTELPITLDALVRDIESLSPDLKASILLMDASGRRLLHGAAPSLPSAYNAAINGVAIGPKVGSCGTAAYFNKQIIVTDISTDPLWEDYRELAETHKLRACWSTPITSGNEVLGTFALYFDRPRSPHESHFRIINMAQHVVSLAITHNRRELRIKQLAFYDSLTGLPNRALGMDRLNRALADAQRRKEPLALLFIDLDGFKIINDSLGHAVGDKLLQLAATRLDQCVRDNDTVARLGGDEFIVILHGSTDDLAEVVIQKILDASTRPFQVFDHSLHISCSIGIALYPNDSTDAANLLRNADAAMYRAKELGRNNAQYYTEALNRAALERITLESELREALQRNEFVLHFQPRVNNRSGAIIGFEALVRWQHPSRDLLGPNSFISVAEQSGLIVTLGEWVLRQACKQIVDWQMQTTQPLSISVNLSPRQFMDKDLVNKIHRSIKETGISPQTLELEITESMVMDNSQDSTTQLHQLKALGVTLAIDDFGTGFSSLSRLKHMPVDVLKIDKSFVDGIPDDMDDTAIATTIIAMGHHLKLKIVAEGVETYQQQKFLSDNQCDEMQGYLFGKPLPADEALEFMRATFSPSDT